MDYCFKEGHIFEIINKGMIDTEHFKTISKPIDVFELLRKEDVDELMSSFNVTRLHYVGTDMMTNHMRETVDSMNDETFTVYLLYHYFICERPDMVGMTHHSLDIFRKE